MSEAEETVACSSCGTAVSFHRRTCHGCEEDIGFPNVRKAKDEEAELSERYSSAIATVKARNVSQQLDTFEKSFTESKAVWVRPFNYIMELINSDNGLHGTFSQQVAGNMRLAESNGWDELRETVESSIHPLYADKIVYSALSLSDMGVLSNYGNCHIVFKSEYIENRTSLFEENPFHFMVRHKVITGRAIPKGYRATWENRGLLAVAKLHNKIQPSTIEADYQNILVSGGGDDTDFIEAHTYGSIHARSFDKITFAGVLKPMEKALLNGYKNRISGYGIELVGDND